MTFLNKSIKHLIHVLVFITVSLLFLEITGVRNYKKTDPIQLFGYRKAIILYVFKLITFLPLPIVLFNMLGLVVYDTFRNDELKLRRATLLDPFICFRVVTRGNYPHLVASNVQRNINLCKEIGLDKFIIEVVTDNELNLAKNAHIRELVVPENYRTKTGAKYKARALQYALEDSVNILSDEDWIVHLDEETLLTKSSLIGILNFLYENKHHIGQGVITYGKEEIVNWVTTLADSIRVASDYGVLRFCLKTFHRPLFSFKGSFIVCKASTERTVSYENGLKGSIAEDSYFAIQAINHGYTFDWVEGEMMEKSPFSFWDFVQQRKRWVQGLYLLSNDSNVNSNITKICFIYSLYIWMMLPFQLFNVILSIVSPISFFQLDDLIGRVSGVIFLYLFMFGAFKTFNIRRQSFLLNAACIVGSLLSIPYVLIGESFAVLWAIFSNKKQFYVVSKAQGQTLEVV